MRRDLSRVLSAKCNRFAYTYNKQGFLCKFSLLTLLMIATEPIPVPEELRQVQAHPGGLDEAVSGEIRCGHRPSPAGADAHPAPGQGFLRQKYPAENAAWTHRNKELGIAQPVH